MTDPRLRVYHDPAEIGLDGYPYVWHKGEYPVPLMGTETDAPPDPSVKDSVRELAGHRCERCGHPYEKGSPRNSPRSEWTPCDEHCTHYGHMRWTDNLGNHYYGEHFTHGEALAYGPGPVEAQWRILTVHHLNGVKHDLRWWNLAALCQRCHLTIQAKVHMHREWNREHTEWFKPHAAGFYAAEILGLDMTREQVLGEMDEILETQLLQHPLEGFV